MESIKTVLMLGRPGSGKGTQTSLLAEHQGWKTLSSGNTFRNLREGDGPLSVRVRETYDQGLLFPDWFPSYLFLNTLLNIKQEEGIVCEGFSRSVEQAQIFHEALEWLGRPYVVFNLEVSEEESTRRQAGRNKTDVRTDSGSPEIIQKRFAEYTNKTAPVLNFFKEKGTLVQIDGEQTPEQIAAELIQKLQEMSL
jgi:adenylate kinase